MAPPTEPEVPEAAEAAAYWCPEHLQACPPTCQVLIQWRDTHDLPDHWQPGDWWDPQGDPWQYHPRDNPHGWDPVENPCGYHPQHQPECWHPDRNPEGFHPDTNPHAWHPDYNPCGYHPRSEPHCWEPDRNPEGYHPEYNPNCWHPDYNPYGWHPDYQPYCWHPTAAPFGWSPIHQPFGWHPVYYPWGYDPYYNPGGWHPQENPDGDADPNGPYTPEDAEGEEPPEPTDPDEPSGRPGDEIDRELQDQLVELERAKSAGEPVEDIEARIRELEDERREAETPEPEATPDPFQEQLDELENQRRAAMDAGDDDSLAEIDARIREIQIERAERDGTDPEDAPPQDAAAPLPQEEIDADAPPQQEDAPDADAEAPADAAPDVEFAGTRDVPEDTGSTATRTRATRRTPTPERVGVRRVRGAPGVAGAHRRGRVVLVRRGEQRRRGRRW